MKYGLQLISEVGLSGAKLGRHLPYPDHKERFTMMGGVSGPTGTPMDVNVKLTFRQYDDQTSKNQDESLTDQASYEKLIGKLLYLNMTRPNISYNVQTLSQFLHQPKKSHMDVALRVVKYIKGQPGQGILLSSKCGTEIIAYCDADWAACPLTRKSVTGYVIKLGESVVSWKAKKQTIVSRSSDEAEYRSLASTVVELVLVSRDVERLKS
ncbi:uncharacterized mitochondrial protein AtMg00810-like [Solanum tuberosum]|uniref:uncharacterized mitochondrial protein AtMg00810-like n=1 Tax=Solanum tuberosum TaxID=4113 RepID=UPI00073A2925|nr:PREDICTED: uncharacterized mitochondrial protein AtMg00810-like [Solanum tuberosum]